MHKQDGDFSAFIVTNGEIWNSVWHNFTKHGTLKEDICYKNVCRIRIYAVFAFFWLYLLF